MATTPAPRFRPTPPNGSQRYASGAGRQRAQSVPAYVIFHDSTLRDIALRRPLHLDELATVNGVGAGKLERYGTAVLDALAGAH